MIVENRKFKVQITASNIEKYREKYNCKLHDIIEVEVHELSDSSEIMINVICDVCNKELKKSYKDYNRSIKNGGYFSCSRKCSNEKKKQTCLEKYGVDNVSKDKTIRDKAITNIKKYFRENQVVEKIKKTKKLRYKDENYNNIAKYKQTCIEKYGVDSVLKLKSIREKIKKTCLERYNKDTYLHCEDFKNKEYKPKYNLEKYKQTCIEKYGYDHFSKTEESINRMKENNPLSDKRVLEKSINTKLKKRMEKYSDKYTILDIRDGIYIMECDNNKNHIFEIEYNNFRNRKKYNTIICTQCNPINNFNESGKELEFKQMFNNCKYDIIFNSRNIINPYELDIFIPELNVAFEFNGMYWHSSKFKNMFYHQYKYNLCMEKDIQLISVWENDWDNNKQSIKDIIDYYLSDKIPVKHIIKFDHDQIMKIDSYNKTLIKENITNYMNSNNLEKLTFDNSYVDIKFLLEIGFEFENITEPKLLDHTLSIYNGGNLIFSYENIIPETKK